MNITININNVQGDIVVNNYYADGKNVIIRDKENTVFEDYELKKLINKIYHVKKTDTLKLAAAYKNLAMDNKAVRTYFCSTRLEFLVSKEKRKLNYINTCCVRLCPMCQYRRSLKVYRESRIVFDSIKQKYSDTKFIFLTLTVKNVDGDLLKGTIEQLLKAVNSMFRYKDMKAFVLGNMRTLEVTYNSFTGKYHPHIHCLIHTTIGLYTGRNYLRQEDYTNLWIKALKIDYIPIVDVRAFKPKNAAQEGRELAELAKYSVKPSDYITSPNINTLVSVLDSALDNKKLVSYTGTFREERRILKLQDNELNLSDTGINIETDDEVEKVIFEWHFGDNKYKKV